MVDLIVNLKTCTKCGEEWPESAFHANGKSSSTHSHCGECRRVYFRDYYRNNKGAHRDRQLMRKYGLTSVDVDLILIQQGGGCAICGRTDPQSLSGWHVDHDHETGDVRGVLCHSCNLGIGYFRDNSSVLSAAIAYLGKG